MIDDWIGSKIGKADDAPLTREAIETYQLAALRGVIARAKRQSRYYAEALSHIEPIRDLRAIEDIAKLPLMDEGALAARGEEMICVPASDVSRIVTQPTSGTTGAPKRVYFTEADQELMIDYNHHGLRVMVESGEVFLILMPCARPGSVGDLARIGLERLGAEVIPAGILPCDGSRDDETLDLMANRRVNAMLATTSAALRLAKRSASGGRDGIRKDLRTILLSAEYVSDDARKTIESVWSCAVFEHYGMTEMGLGGAMACNAHVGYHPREADILFEIIDPETGAPLPDGARGEIVFTTLTREAMPFIRYRTGDFSRFLPEPCPCGSTLKRLDKVANRNAVKGY
jgi:phenylacetate-coenzyme A ligase PaaK-like adenylate-forming protein